MQKTIKIGNAQGFWGDRAGAAASLQASQPDLDYLTMDYLAEVSMSILARQKARHPKMGYARDFIEELKLLAPFWKKGAKVKVVANSGGLNPEGCAEAAADALREAGLSGLKIGIVKGDDVLEMLAEGAFPNLDTGESIDQIRENLISANAYLGAKAIVEALNKEADIVITGRCADPSLTVGCCVHAYDWKWEEYDKLAAGTVAGHLIECGTQVTGGILTNWLEVPDPAHTGYPVIEMCEDASFIVTKPSGTGGCVNEETVKEQLLYEIGDPANYISPDVTVSFLDLQLAEEAQDRVKVTGAKGKPPPPKCKVSATFHDGYRAEGTLVIFGRHVQEKAQRCGEVVLQRVKECGYDLARSWIECLGAGDVVAGVLPETPGWSLRECVLRIAVADPREEAVRCFSKELAPLVTSGAQGVTGYFGGRPKPRQVIGFWPCLIEKEHLKPVVEIIEVAP